MQIRDRIKELRRVPASELLPNPKNWRTHPVAQQDALRGVLAEVGYADALIARETPEGLINNSYNKIKKPSHVGLMKGP